MEVFGTVPLTPPIQAGTLAEYALMPAASVAVKPPGLDFVTAAATAPSGCSGSGPPPSWTTRWPRSPSRCGPRTRTGWTG